MDQDKLSQSQTQEDNPKSAAEALAAPSPALDAVKPPTNPTTGAPLRPRRPQRSARVEGSVDITEAKNEPSPQTDQDENTPDGSVASHLRHSQPATEERTRPASKAGPKRPGPHPVRAASVPQPPTSRPAAPHLNPHALRAFSVAGTADTQPQTVEDFR